MSTYYRKMKFNIKNVSSGEIMKYDKCEVNKEVKNLKN